MVPKSVIDLAVSNGFSSAEELGEWNGFTVFNTKLGEEWGDHPRTGAPVFILLDEHGSCRLASVDEMRSAYDTFYVRED